MTRTSHQHPGDRAQARPHAVERRPRQPGPLVGLAVLGQCEIEENPEQRELVQVVAERGELGGDRVIDAIGGVAGQGPARIPGIDGHGAA